MAVGFVSFAMTVALPPPAFGAFTIVPAVALFAPYAYVASCTMYGNGCAGRVYDCAERRRRSVARDDEVRACADVAVDRARVGREGLAKCLRPLGGEKVAQGAASKEDIILPMKHGPSSGPFQLQQNCRPHLTTSKAHADPAA
jgi:hypothetical protein